MPHIASAVVLILGLTINVAAQQKPATSFAGTWVLDKPASKGLSPAMTDAEKVTWTIVQDEKTITINEAVSGGARPGGGSLGTYGLDGVEASSNAGGGNATVTLRAKWTGGHLELLRRQTVGGATPIETNASRTLALAPDGKTLTVTSRYESARGNSVSTLVFGK